MPEDNCELLIVFSLPLSARIALVPLLVYVMLEMEPIERPSCLLREVAEGEVAGHISSA